MTCIKYQVSGSVYVYLLRYHCIYVYAYSCSGSYPLENCILSENWEMKIGVIQGLTSINKSQ